MIFVPCQLQVKLTSMPGELQPILERRKSLRFHVLVREGHHLIFPSIECDRSTLPSIYLQVLK
jgi:hypothetical protein